MPGLPLLRQPHVRHAEGKRLNGESGAGGGPVGHRPARGIGPGRPFRPGAEAL